MPTLETLPLPAAVAQEVTPAPSVCSDCPAVPGVVGMVNVHVPAFAAPVSVTVPEVEPARLSAGCVMPVVPLMVTVIAGFLIRTGC